MWCDIFFIIAPYFLIVLGERERAVFGKGRGHGLKVELRLPHPNPSRAAIEAIFFSLCHTCSIFCRGRGVYMQPPPNNLEAPSFNPIYLL